MSQSVWHRDDIKAAMNAIDEASSAIAGRIDTEEMALYRLGFDTALRSLAVAFGIDWRSGMEMVKRAEA